MLAGISFSPPIGQTVPSLGLPLRKAGHVPASQQGHPPLGFLSWQTQGNGQFGDFCHNITRWCHSS